MANKIRIKRRASGGGAGAPSSLENAELAFNEQTNVLYYGTGTGGAGGTATSVIAIGGDGAFADLSTNQTIGGTKTFSSTISGSVSGNAGTVTNGVYTTDTATVTNTMLAGSIANAKLLNSSVTIGSTSVSLGATATTLAGLTSVTSTSFVGALTGNASTATALATGRTISITGDLSYTSPSFDGSGNVTAAGTLANSGVTAGTYTKITVDAKGRATVGATASISDLSVPTADVAFNAKKITGLADPVSAQDAATKAYVDASNLGLDVKDSVRVATTANITLSGTQTIDGVSVIAGDRVLVKDQSTGSANGIYVVAAGSWSRATDANTSAKVTSGLYTFVEEGTANADAGFILTTNNPITLDTTSLSFTQFTGAGQITAGAGLTKTGNTIDVATASTARIVVNADSIDLATAGTAGTYKSVTTDAYGRVTAGTNPTTLSGYGITDAQPLDATLTALAGVTTAANSLIYATASDTFTTTTLSAYGRTLIDDADAATARTTLGLGTIATQASSSVSITGGSITNLTTFDGITIDGGTY